MGPTPSVLVVYATRYGSTREVAERIGMRLRSAGASATVAPAGPALDPSGFDAYVVGSAAYYGSWLTEAVRFVRRHAELLARRPTWVFTSGPLGPGGTDAEGRDKRSVAVTDKIRALVALVGPRDHRVFFGALDPSRLMLSHRLLTRLPATRAPWARAEGDFRDWDEIEAWADAIAASLASDPGPAGAA